MTCNACKADWSQAAAHCSGCHVTFSSDSAFDRHLVSGVTGGCQDPATVRTRKGVAVLAWNEKRQVWSMAPPIAKRAFPQTGQGSP
jgi:hypothetical protein